MCVVQRVDAAVTCADVPITEGQICADGVHIGFVGVDTVLEQALDFLDRNCSALGGSPIGDNEIPLISFFFVREFSVERAHVELAAVVQIELQRAAVGFVFPLDEIVSEREFNGNQRSASADVLHLPVGPVHHEPEPIVGV